MDIKHVMVLTFSSVVKLLICVEFNAARKSIGCLLLIHLIFIQIS